MFKRRVAPVLALLFVVFAQTAQAFFDPPWITPAAPMAGDTVSVNIHGGICDSIVEEPGYPQITQDGNAIRFREYGHHYEPGDELCIYGIGTVTQSIGTFAPGNYTLTVELAYIDGFGTPSIFTIGIVPFTVSGAPASAAPVPATGPLTLFVLILVLAGMACAMRHRHLGVLWIVLACASFGVRAQPAADNRTIQVLLTKAPGAPTPAQVVNYCNASPRPPTPPLQAFNTKSPAAGDFAAGV